MSISANHSEYKVSSHFSFPFCAGSLVLVIQKLSFGGEIKMFVGYDMEDEGKLAGTSTTFRAVSQSKWS
jgi:hypothetical protein